MHPDRTLYVGNLPFDVDEEDVKALLEARFGELEALLFPRNNSGRPAGHAYVSFADAAAIEAALAPDCAPVLLHERELRLARYSASKRERLRRNRVKPKEMRRLAAIARTRKEERMKAGGNDAGRRGGRGRDRDHKGKGGRDRKGDRRRPALASKEGEP